MHISRPNLFDGILGEVFTIICIVEYRTRPSNTMSSVSLLFPVGDFLSRHVLLAIFEIKIKLSTLNNWSVYLHICICFCGCKLYLIWNIIRNRNWCHIYVQRHYLKTKPKGLSPNRTVQLWPRNVALQWYQILVKGPKSSTTGRFVQQFVKANYADSMNESSVLWLLAGQMWSRGKKASRKVFILWRHHGRLCVEIHSYP